MKIVDNTKTCKTVYVVNMEPGDVVKGKLDTKHNTYEGVFLRVFETIVFLNDTTQTWEVYGGSNLKIEDATYVKLECVVTDK